MDPAPMGEVGNNGSIPINSGATPPPEQSFTDKLISSGYDPARAASIASMMMANASKTPAAPTASVAPIKASTATAGTAAPVADAASTSWEDVLGYGTGVEIGDTSVHQREVKPEELVEEQLAGLLSGNSRYIRNARLQGYGLANKRGQFGSSWSAGAAEKAAIQEGIPIAIADAQAYRDAATQNLDALNNFSLANIQRATSIDTALIGANTNISIANMDKATRLSLANLDALTRTNIANLDADTQTKIANLSSQTQVAVQNSQNQLSLIMQSRNMQHETGLEQLRQQGQVDVTLLDGAIRQRLAKFELDGLIQRDRLNHEDNLELNEVLFQYDLEKKAEDNKYLRQTQHSASAIQAQTNYINYITAFKDTDMDAAAAARLQQDAWNNLVAELELINSLYPEQPPIIPKR